MLVTELLKNIRDQRLAQYRDLVCRAGQADANESELNVADLDQLDAIIQALNIEAKQVAADLAAARSWHIHSTQRAEAEAAKPTAEKRIVALQSRLASSI